MATGNVRINNLTNFADLSGAVQTSAAQNAAKTTTSFGDALSKATSARTGSEDPARVREQEVRDRDRTPNSDKAEAARDSASEKEVKGNSDDASQKERTETVKTDKTNAEKQDIDGKEQPDSAVEEAVQEIREVIRDVTGLTDEDIEQAMETLGLSALDLLQSDNIPNLMAELTGEDVSAVLTDESLYGQVNEVLNLQRGVVADLMQELNMTPEEFQIAVESGTLLNVEELPELPEAPFRDGDLREEPGLPNFREDLGRAERNIGQVRDYTAISEENAAGTRTETAGVASEVLKPDRQPERTIEINVEEKPEQPARPMARPEMRGQMGSGQESSGQEFHAGSGNLGAIFDENLFQAINETQNTEATGFAGTYEQIRNIMDQVEEQVKLSIKPDTTEMEMQLNPAHLGRLSLHVETTGGVVTAHLSAQNESVRAALESQIVELKETLEAQGLKVENVEVTIASHAFEQNFMNGGQQNQGFANSEQSSRAARLRRINLNGGGDSGIEGGEGPADSDDELVRQMMIQNGNRVDYTA
ncbi:MAG: flagellar hook-length control protein FliK [Lachnospiraceae bacterium]|nr:flagellar hook-length control protein FliK [Lachnospiraceae bacterium]